MTQENTSADNLGLGKHIKVLLDFARQYPRTGDYETDKIAREKIIKDWNRWIRSEREDDDKKKFQLHLSGFNGNADVWKETPLWGKVFDYPQSSDQLILMGIDFKKARFIGAVLREAYLCYVDLEGSTIFTAHLEGANLSYANLKNAKIQSSWLDGVKLACAHLEQANFSRSDLKKADLKQAKMLGTILDNTHLDGAEMHKAQLKMADLSYAQLNDAVLSGADITGAIVRRADFTHADVSFITYERYSGVWPFRCNLMRNKYHGIRGLDSCFGKSGFRRDALDQDFIDEKLYDCIFLRKNGWEESIRAVELEDRIRAIKQIHCYKFDWLLNSRIGKIVRAVRWKQLPKRLPKRVLFCLWSLSDYGRSVLGSFVYVLGIIGLFGLLYYCCLIPAEQVKLAAPLKDKNFWDALYAAGMGAATLGLTDLMSPITVWGKLAMLVNAISGLVLFGMIIAVMQNKFARRA